MYNKLLQLFVFCFLINQTVAHAEELRTQEYGLNNQGNYNDVFGDTDIGYVDLTNIRVIIDDKAIEVRLQFRSAFDKVPYNQISTCNNCLEHTWQIYFDVDLNSSVTNDISFAISSFKHPKSKKKYDSILNFTQKDIWQTSNDNYGSILPNTKLHTSIDGNFLIFKAYKTEHEALSLITDKTPIRVLTITTLRGETFYDMFPDNK